MVVPSILTWMTLWDLEPIRKLYTTSDESTMSLRTDGLLMSATVWSQAPRPTGNNEPVGMDDEDLLKRGCLYDVFHLYKANRNTHTGVRDA